MEIDNFYFRSRMIAFYEIIFKRYSRSRIKKNNFTQMKNVNNFKNQTSLKTSRISLVVSFLIPMSTVYPRNIIAFGFLRFFSNYHTTLMKNTKTLKDNTAIKFRVKSITDHISKKSTKLTISPQIHHNVAN